MLRISGIVLIIGVICFFVGVALPVVSDVFQTSDKTLQLQYIEANPDQWELGNLLVGIGGIITALGILLFSFALQQTDSDSRVIAMSYVAAIAAGLASALLMWICYKRSTLPPAEVADNLNINSWAYPVYAVFTALGILLVGFIIMRLYSKIAGGLVIVVDGILLLILIATGDLPPVAYYVLTLIIGITLLIAKQRKIDDSQHETNNPQVVLQTDSLH
jgi:hypothetical protein